MKLLNYILRTLNTIFEGIIFNDVFFTLSLVLMYMVIILGMSAIIFVLMII